MESTERGIGTFSPVPLRSLHLSDSKSPLDRATLCSLRIILSLDPDIGYYPKSEEDSKR